MNPSRSNLWFATCGGACALVGSLLVSGCSNAPEPRVEGRMASGGGYLGDWDLYPNHCSKVGDAVVLDNDGDAKRTVRLIDRSRGTSSTLSKVEIRLSDETPSGPINILLTDATCVTGSFEGSGARTGDLRIDCETGEGGHVVGALKFANCR